MCKSMLLLVRCWRRMLTLFILFTKVKFTSHKTHVRCRPSESGARLTTWSWTAKPKRVLTPAPPRPRKPNGRGEMKRDQRAAETDGIIENAPAKRWYHLQLHIATLVTSCAVWGGRREGPCTSYHSSLTNMTPRAPEATPNYRFQSEPGPSASLGRRRPLRWTEALYTHLKTFHPDPR